VRRGGTLGGEGPRLVLAILSDPSRPHLERRQARFGKPFQQLSTSQKPGPSVSATRRGPAMRRLFARSKPAGQEGHSVLPCQTQESIQKLQKGMLMRVGFICICLPFCRLNVSPLTPASASMPTVDIWWFTLAPFRATAHSRHSHLNRHWLPNQHAVYPRQVAMQPDGSAMSSLHQCSAVQCTHSLTHSQQIVLGSSVLSPHPGSMEKHALRSSLPASSRPF